MITVIQREGEKRADYLIRVAVAYLEEVNQFEVGYLTYDSAECDASCLATDLQDEFSHIDFEEQ